MRQAGDEGSRPSTSGDPGSIPGRALRLVLPLPPSLTNSGRGRSRHWRALKRERDAYWCQCDGLQACGTVPAPPAAPMERALITVSLYVWAPMDADNAMARCKWALDWMRSRGYVADDAPRNLAWTGLPAQWLDRKAQRLEITIEPVQVAGGEEPK